MTRPDLEPRAAPMPAPVPAGLLPAPHPVPPTLPDDLPPGTPVLLYTPYGLQPWTPRPRAWWRTWLGALLWSLIPAIGLGIGVVWVQTRERPETFQLGDAAVSAFLHIAGLVLAGAMLLAAWWLLSPLLGGSGPR